MDSSHFKSVYNKGKKTGKQTKQKGSPKNKDPGTKGTKRNLYSSSNSENTSDDDTNIPHTYTTAQTSSPVDNTSRPTTNTSNINVTINSNTQMHTNGPHGHGVEDEDNNLSHPPPRPLSKMSAIPGPADRSSSVQRSGGSGYLRRTVSQPVTMRTSSSALSRDGRLIPAELTTTARAFAWRIKEGKKDLQSKTSNTSWGPMVGQDTLDKKSSFPVIANIDDDLETYGYKKGRQSTKADNIRARLNCTQLILYDLKVVLKRWRKKSWKNPLFGQYIRKTENRFGSGIVSLFLFTRWIFCLNLFLALMWIGFVIVPNAIRFPYETVTKSFSIKHFIDGKGAVGQLWFFYGQYPGKLPYYYEDVAYLALILLTYFGSMFIILKSIARSKSNMAKSVKDDRFKFSMLAWCSWDYSVTSAEAIDQLHKGVISMIKDNVAERQAQVASEKRTSCEKYKIYIYRLLAWIITILLVGGGCTAITFLVMFVNFGAGTEETVTNTSNVTTTAGAYSTTAQQQEEEEENESFVKVYGTTIIFILINIIVPMFIKLLPRMESYATGRAELSVTLVRVFVLRMANLVALLASLYSTIKGIVGTENTSNGTGTIKQQPCVGTLVGQEMYKLVILDTLVHAIGQIVWSYSRYAWTLTKQELNLPSAILVVIYRQALVWVGTMACPVLPLFGLLSNCIFFLVNYLIVHKTCKPPSKRWTQSKDSTLFHGFLLATLFLITIPVGIVLGSDGIINLGLSGKGVKNGPFGTDRPTEAFRIFRDEMPYVLMTIIYWLMSDTVILPLFFILLIVISYLYSRIGYQNDQQVIFKADLLQEREDNKEMMKRLQMLK